MLLSSAAIAVILKAVTGVFFSYGAAAVSVIGSNIEPRSAFTETIIAFPEKISIFSEPFLLELPPFYQQ
ncbi:MAG: hypothetical protein U9R66_05960 [Thermodesulfobacteriota bacterium]|nr:hypothetical protein [Thermodesulfobacteriota bacterium]